MNDASTFKNNDNVNRNNGLELKHRHKLGRTWFVKNILSFMEVSYL